MFEDIIKPGIVLFIIAFIMVGILAFINGSTETTIEANRLSEKKDAMKEVLPELENSFLEDEIMVDYLQNDDFQHFTEDGQFVYSYAEYKSNDQLAGYAVITRSQGYNGKILVVVGMDPEGIISGVKLIEHGETPGLGANAEKPEFVNQYVGKSGILSVTKSQTPKDDEIDAITAATITTQAVTDAVNYATIFFENNLKGVN